MKTANPCPMTFHKGLRDSIDQWTKLTTDEQLNWDGCVVREAINAAIAPASEGYGAVRIKLLDSMEGFGVEALSHLMLQLSKQVGYILPQTYENNLVGLIQDEGKDYKHHRSRGHKTRAELGYHCDRSDFIFLLYARSAQSGGEVSVVSFEDAVTEIQKKAPDLADILFKDFPFDLRDERIFSAQEWCEHPILWHTRSGVRGNYIRRFIFDSQRHADCPRLTDFQLLALSAFEKIMEDLGVNNTFKPEAGELVILNNYRVLHARKGFSNEAHNDLGRLAIRTWVAPYQSEPLPDFMLPISGAVSPGCFRGGIGCGDAFLGKLGTTDIQLIDGPTL